MMYEMREFGDSLGRVRSVDNLASITRNQDSEFPTQSTPDIKRVYSESNFKRALLCNKEEKAIHSQRSLGWFSSPPSPQLPTNMDIRTSVCNTSRMVQHTTLGSTAAVALPIKSVYYMPHSYVVWPSPLPASPISCDPVEKYTADINSLSSQKEVFGLECQDIKRGILTRGNMKVNECSSPVLPAVHQHQQNRQNNKQAKELQFAGCVPLEGIIYPSPSHRAPMNQSSKPEFSGSPYPLTQTLENLSEFDAYYENALYHANSPLLPYAGMCPGNSHGSPGIPYQFSQPSTNTEPVFFSHNENVQSMGCFPALYTASHPGIKTENPRLLCQSPPKTRKSLPSYAPVSDTKPSMVYPPTFFTTPYCQTRPQCPEIWYQLPQQLGEAKPVFTSSKKSNEFCQSFDHFHQNSVIPSEPSVSFVKPRSPLQHNEFPNQALPGWTSQRQTPPVPIIQLAPPCSTTDDSPSSPSSLPSSSCMCSQCMDRGSPPSPHKSPRKNWSLRKFLLDRMLASSPHSSMGSTTSLGSRGSAGDV